MKTRRTMRISHPSYIALAILCAISSISMPTFSVAAAVADQTASKIAFDRAGRIYTMNADGSNQTMVGNPNVLAADPSSSPDGTKIAFACGTEPNNICVMNADGSNLNVLTNLSADSSPAWSPDGTKIAFHSAREGDRHIYFISPNGGAVTRLIVNDASLIAEYSPTWSPAWSPDGTRIAFNRVTIIRDENGSTINRDESLYTMNADGSGVLKLNVIGSNPVFQPVQQVPPPSKTPAERIAELDALVRGFNLHHGMANSLTVKLRGALDALNAGNTAAACAKLADFTNHTRAQSGKKLTAAQAAQLIDEANSIRAALGCS